MAMIRTAQTVVPEVSGRPVVILTVRNVQEEISTFEDETTRLYVVKCLLRQNSI